MKKKFLITMSVVACALLLVVGSIAGTVAYLTSVKTVTNTFTVGNISITLDEAKVGDDGKALTGVDAARVEENQYHIVPNGEYDKDPLITLAAKSDSCYLFVKVVNGLASVEETEGGTTIAAQLAANGWVALDGVTNVYVYTNAGNSVVATSNAAQEFPVFTKVIIEDAVTNEQLAALDNKTVAVTAYAVQSAGFTDAKDAWISANFT